MTQIKVYDDDASMWFISDSGYADYVLDISEQEASRIVAAQVEWQEVQQIIQRRVNETRAQR